MQHQYDTLAEYHREGFRIIVDKTWEDTHPRDCFDSEDDKMQELCEMIDRGLYDWFMLRVRVLVDDVELAQNYLGGCCYKDARETLTDGVAEDLIWNTLYEARQRLTGLAKRFTMMAIKYS